VDAQPASIASAAAASSAEILFIVSSLLLGEIGAASQACYDRRPARK
jgi:hypothetical protein